MNTLDSNLTNNGWTRLTRSTKMVRMGKRSLNDLFIGFTKTVSFPKTKSAIFKYSTDNASRTGRLNPLSHSTCHRSYNSGEKGKPSVHLKSSNANP